jgi:hypothetical protein
MASTLCHLVLSSVPLELSMASTRCHDHLSHAAQPIIERVVKEFNLPCSPESNKESLYDPCQQEKPTNYLILNLLVCRVSH